ncbi:MAG: response regulator, partial [Bacteroidia bacterium]|nr:response regulator [Bacteroidia bacterium]
PHPPTPSPQGEEEHLASRTESKRSSAEPIQDPGSSNGQPVILIVEDNSDLRAYIRGYLDESYHITEARDGVEGFEKAIKEVPDLILSDVMMPGMDGFELCEKLKSDERTSHIPVILLTARAAPESKLEGLETGADDFLTKPFDPDELHIRIRNLISGRKRLRERYLREMGIKDLSKKEKSGKKELVSLDQKFLIRARGIVEKYLSDETFDIPRFSDEMHLSRTQVHRKLKALVDQSASEFIRTIRITYAAKLLEHKTGNISEIALEVGFSNPAYFAECFKKQFGILPSEFIKNK